MQTNNHYFLAVGMLSLTIAILLGRYVEPHSVVDFLEGFLYAFSVVINLAYLLRTSRRKKIKPSDK